MVYRILKSIQQYDSTASLANRKTELSNIKQAAKSAFMEFIHKPIMAQEILGFFRQTTQKDFLDATAGEGGHCLQILQQFPDASLTFADRDQEMLERARQRIAAFAPRTRAVHSNFSELDCKLDVSACEKGFDGILADLGISMFHLLESGRGFSFKKDEKLDMTLDESAKTAADIINFYPEKDLLKIFYEYGEERWSKKIVQSIMEKRQKKEKIHTTEQLALLVEKSIPRKFWPPGKHPAFRIFQALRIEANQELEHIKKGIKTLSSLLKPGGVLCVISFHSLEDRIVKHTMKDLSVQGDFSVLTKKPLLPGELELADNISARSAKLRAIRRNL